MDDITFCMSDCQRTDCLRHPSNIQDRTIPHSYADFKGTETCPEKTQLSKEDATKDATFDCISRQAVIDHINKKREEHLESADLISRQAAILALAEQIMESALMDNPTTASTDINRYRPIAELSLRDVPSAQPNLESAYAEGYTAAEADFHKLRDAQPRWISVAEQLPEEDIEVLTYDSSFGITFDSLHREKWRKHPVAWMPLPEPYKGETE